MLSEKEYVCEKHFLPGNIEHFESVEVNVKEKNAEAFFKRQCHPLHISR